MIITDTDHYAAGKGDALWAWKSFVRGHHPILMDFGIVDVAHPLDAAQGVPPFEAFEPARHAMGDTRRYADRMRLIDMVPSDALTSTRYALANIGKEYLVLQPSDSADALTVELPRGTYVCEWFGVNARETILGGDVVVDGEGNRELKAPFKEPGPAVLYLKRKALNS